MNAKRIIRHQKGQAFTEYALLVAALLGVLTVLSSDSLPLFPTLVDAFQTYLDSLHTVVSLPIP